jgi:hypothetical protein
VGGCALEESLLCHLCFMLLVISVVKQQEKALQSIQLTLQDMVLKSTTENKKIKKNA